MRDIDINGYSLDKKIGESEFCWIYSAVQVSLGRTVALKVLRPEHESNSTVVAKFKLQANAVNDIRHAGIPQVFDSNESNGHHYYTREFVEGTHIGMTVKRHRGMGEENALLTLQNIAAVLDNAWQECELVHANLKPENVLVERSGTVKLLDFSGMTASASATLRHALSGVRIGHPAYSAPETIQDNNAIDFRSDIYSLGALFYFMMTGREPFQNYPQEEAHFAHDYDYLPHPWDLRIKCSEAASVILQKLTIKDPAGRYPSWQDLLLDVSIARSNRIPEQSILNSHISTVKNAKCQPKEKMENRPPTGHRIAETLIYVLLGIFIAVNIYLFILIFG